MNYGLALDLGCANWLATTPVDSKIYREPSVIAIHRRNGSILAIGKEAIAPNFSPGHEAAMLRPFRNGLTSNCDITYHVMHTMLMRSFGKDFRGERLLLSVPCSISDAEELALVETAMKTGVKSCHLIYSPIAAMSAEYISPFEHCILVDMGAVRTNIMVLSGGKIIYRRTIMVGGESFDGALAQYLLDNQGVYIGMRAAEQLKLKGGTVFDDGVKIPSQTVVGKDAQTGQEVTITVTAEDMYRAFEQPMADILDPICVAIMKIPMPLVERVLQTGITLCGGCAALHGMQPMIEGVTGVHTSLASHPADAVAMGMATILPDLPQKIPSGIRNISSIYIENFLASK
ncbi:MAG: rod shape-determining protein [Clostridia bacterium]|nr:rod shape-determining protein [Clostridia bacterium]